MFVKEENPSLSPGIVTQCHLEVESPVAFRCPGRLRGKHAGSKNGSYATEATLRAKREGAASRSGTKSTRSCGAPAAYRGDGYAKPRNNIFAISFLSHFFLILFLDDREPLPVESTVPREAGDDAASR